MTTMTPSDGDDRLVGTAGDDCSEAQLGNDRVFGLDGADKI